MPEVTGGGRRRPVLYGRWEPDSILERVMSESPAAGVQPVASVVIVNWNGEAYVAECIEAVLAQTVPVEVIVVDNNSADASVAMIRERFGSRVRLLPLGVNAG